MRLLAIFAALLALAPAAALADVPSCNPFAPPPCGGPCPPWPDGGQVFCECLHPHDCGCGLRTRLSSSTASSSGGFVASSAASSGSGTGSTGLSATTGSGTTGREKAGDEGLPQQGCSLGQRGGLGLGPWLLAMAAPLLIRRRRR